MDQIRKLLTKKMPGERRTQILNDQWIQVDSNDRTQGDFRNLFSGDGPLTLTLSPRGGERERVEREFEFLSGAPQPPFRAPDDRTASTSSSVPPGR